VIAAGRDKSSESATAAAKSNTAFVTAADSTKADNTKADRDSSEFTEAPLSDTQISGSMSLSAQT